jgi:23S rRNA pseudouridine1911/1915/1917 synthase
MTTVVVRDGNDGDRVDVALAAACDVSRSRAAAWIADGSVTRDGRPVRRSDRVRAGEQLTVALPPETDAADASPPPPLPPVRWEDEHLLVLAKPPGLVVHPGAGHPDGTLVDALRGAGVSLASRGAPDRPGIVHRLDRDTSGLLVVARTDRAHDGLVAQLRDRTVHRRYLALAEGRLPSPTGRIDVPIGRDPRDRQRFAAVAEGKPAVTHWEVVASTVVDTAAVTLLRCRLETGRTHQIRVHLAFAGAPVVGDLRYGASRAVADRLGIDRPVLHAAELGFDHPVTGARVEVVEPLPADLRAALRAAGLDAGPGVADDGGPAGG